MAQCSSDQTSREVRCRSLLDPIYSRNHLKADAPSLACASQVIPFDSFYPSIYLFARYPYQAGLEGISQYVNTPRANA